MLLRNQSDYIYDVVSTNNYILDLLILLAPMIFVSTHMCLHTYVLHAC
jgi:hypothetical protein